MKRKGTSIGSVLLLALLALIASRLWPATSTPSGSGAEDIFDALRAKRSDVRVQGRGVVTKILPDDEEGARHQRFILEIEGGHTLLVAHNIDIAPRAPVARGDTVEFLGVYETNAKGGVIHWTHHDPRGRRPGGRLRHEGRTYE